MFGAEFLDATTRAVGGIDGPPPTRVGWTRERPRPTELVEERFGANSVVLRIFGGPFVHVSSHTEGVGQPRR